MFVDDTLLYETNQPEIETQFSFKYKKYFLKYLLKFIFFCVEEKVCKREITCYIV